MKHLDFPRIDLTLAEDGGYHILFDASFRLDDSSAASRRLVIDPPRGKYFRAICILMLLAKYRGEGFADKDGIIWFKDRMDRLTWIKALGTSFGKGAQADFFRDYFQNHRFLSASRGSGHNTKSKKDGKGVLPSAKYDTRQLPLQNLRFYKSKSKGAKATIIIEDELALFAERLERYEVEKADGWKPIVPELVAETKRDRPTKSQPQLEKVSLDRVDEPQPYILSTRWRELNVHVRNTIKDRANGGDWYVVSVVPGFVLDWNETLRTAMSQHNAKVKIAYQSPSAAKNCSAIRAQLLINSGRDALDAKDGLDYLQKRIGTLKGEIGSWAKGSCKLFESHVNHPFMGILVVPPGSKGRSKRTASAPPGTWCLLGLYPFYQRVMNTRCCLYLNDAGPILDIYYHTILDFFEQGPKDGFLKAVNLRSKR